MIDMTFTYSLPHNFLFYLLNMQLLQDIGFFTSPGDRSYDAIGLMKQLSEHTAATYADAQEVLGDETPETIFKSRISRNQKHDQEKCALQSQPENCSFLASNVLVSKILLFLRCHQLQ